MYWVCKFYHILCSKLYSELQTWLKFIKLILSKSSKCRSIGPFGSEPSTYFQYLISRFRGNFAYFAPHEIHLQYYIGPVSKFWYSARLGAPQAGPSFWSYPAPLYSRCINTLGHKGSAWRVIPTFEYYLFYSHK